MVCAHFSRPQAAAASSLGHYVNKTPLPSVASLRCIQKKVHWVPGGLSSYPSPLPAAVAYLCVLELPQQRYLLCSWEPRKDRHLFEPRRFLSASPRNLKLSDRDSHQDEPRLPAQHWQAQGLGCPYGGAAPSRYLAPRRGALLEGPAPPPGEHTGGRRAAPAPGGLPIPQEVLESAPQWGLPGRCRKGACVGC